MFDEVSDIAMRHLIEAYLRGYTLHKIFSFFFLREGYKQILNQVEI